MGMRASAVNGQWNVGAQEKEGGSEDDTGNFGRRVKITVQGLKTVLD